MIWQAGLLFGSGFMLIVYPSIVEGLFAQLFPSLSVAVTVSGRHPGGNPIVWVVRGSAVQVWKKHFECTQK